MENGQKQDKCKFAAKRVKDKKRPLQTTQGDAS